MNKGLIHIYYGEGKGKTTASLGLLLRSLGWKKKVCLFMFLKPNSYSPGELRALKGKFPNLKIHRYQQVHPIFWKRKNNDAVRKKLNREIKKSLEDLEKEIRKDYDLIVLDEILNLLELGAVSKDFILKIMENKNSNTEVVLTGRRCPLYLKRRADYLMEIKNLKHPYQKKIPARKGIEY